MKNKFLNFFIIFLLSSVFIYAVEIEEDAYITALEAYNKNDFKTAQKLLSEFIQKFPGSKYKAGVLLKLAQLENDFNTAIKMYDEIINNYPGTENEIEAIYLKGILFFTKEKYSDSKKEFEKIIEKFSESIWTEPSYYYLLLNNYTLKNYDEAEKVYKKYSEAGIYRNYRTRMDLSFANVLFSKGRYNEAAELYRAVIDKTNPDDKNIYLPYVYKQLIECYKKRNDTENIIKYENELKEKFPDSKEIFQENKFSEKGTATPVLPVNSSEEFFTVQIGAYTNKKFADIMYKKLLDKKYTVFLKQEGKFYKIQVGRFKTEKEADDYAKDLIKKEKLQTYLIKKAE